jgi:hypothetical protein
VKANVCYVVLLMHIIWGSSSNDQIDRENTGSVRKRPSPFKILVKPFTQGRLTGGPGRGGSFPPFLEEMRNQRTSCGLLNKFAKCWRNRISEQTKSLESLIGRTSSPDPSFRYEFLKVVTLVRPGCNGT